MLLVRCGRGQADRVGLLVLRRALAPLAPRVRAAFIYGSIASGEARPESDVDVMVIGEVARIDAAASQAAPASALA